MNIYWLKIKNRNDTERDFHHVRIKLHKLPFKQIVLHPSTPPSHSPTNSHVFLFLAGISAFRASSFYLFVQTSVGVLLEVQLEPVMQLFMTVTRDYQSRTCGGFSKRICVWPQTEALWTNTSNSSSTREEPPPHISGGGDLLVTV